MSDESKKAVYTRILIVNAVMWVILLLLWLSGSQFVPVPLMIFLLSSSSLVIVVMGIWLLRHS